MIRFFPLRYGTLKTITELTRLERLVVDEQVEQHVRLRQVAVARHAHVARPQRAPPAAPAPPRAPRRVAPLCLTQQLNENIWEQI